MKEKPIRLATGIYILILIIGYMYFVPEFPYKHVVPNYFLLIIVSVLAFIPSLWIPVEIKRASSFVLWVIYIVVIVPSIVIPYLSLEKPFVDVLTFILAVILCFYLVSRITFFRLIKVSPIELSPIAFYVLFFLIFAVNNYLLIKQFGLNLNFVSILDVYDVRASFKDELGEGSNYSIRWLMYIFNPFLIAMGYLKKSTRWLLVIGFFGEFIIYSTTGFKTALFIGFVIVAILYFSQRYNMLKRLPLLIISGTVVLIGLAMLVDFFIFNEQSATPNIVTSIALRRTFVMPGYLTGQYFSFFSENPKALMSSNNFIGSLFSNGPVYNVAVPYIIGQFSFNNDVASANANVLADAFANFGYIGMIVFSLILSFYLYIYDSVTRLIDFRLSFAMLIGPAMFFCNSSLLTALIGHGAIWAIIILYFYQSVSISNGKNN